jgi:hypothetical protein
MLLLCGVLSPLLYALADALAGMWQGASVEEVSGMPSVFIGSVDHIVDEMQNRRERYGISYCVVSDKRLETVTPIVRRLAGG